MANVLVIEDHPQIRMILDLILSENGHSVCLVSNGKMGLERLYMEPQPEVVLVDLNMPSMSGRELVRLMRDDGRLKDIPVVIISGSFPTPDIMPPEGSYQAFIMKPFDLTDILMTVKRLAGNVTACSA